MHRFLPGVVLSVVLASLFSMAAGADESAFEKVKARGTLKAGVKFDAPPFGFVDEKGKNVGFEIELAEALAKKLGVKLVLVQVTSKTRIPLLQNGTVDLVIATMTHTRERDKTIDFSMTYFRTGQSLLVKKGSGIKSVKDLAGKVVATVQGSTSEKNIKAAQPRAKVLTFQEYPQAFLALQQGKASAVTTDAAILQGLRNGNPRYELAGGYFSTEPYGIGVRENDSKWRDFLNTALIEIQESGEYGALSQKWFGKGAKFELPESFSIEIWP